MTLSLTGERQIATTLDQIAPDHRARYEWAAERITEMFGDNASVLDAACGVGYGSFIMANAGHIVTGVDISADAIEHAKKHYSHDSVRYVVDDVLKGDYAQDKKYDVIVSFETIEHLSQDIELMKKFSSISDTLIASVPNELVIPYNKHDFPFHVRHYSPLAFEDLVLDFCMRSANTSYNIMERCMQKDKWTGTVENGEDGRTLILIASVINNKHDRE